METLFNDVVVGEFIRLLFVPLVVYVVARLTHLVVRVGHALLDFARARLDDKIEARIMEGVLLAVQAAEQSGLAGKIRNEGEAKFDYAFHVLSSFLARYHIDLPADVIEAKLESAIRQGLQG